MDFVIHKGYRRIAHLAGTQISTVGRERYNGYVKSLKSHHIPYNEKLVVECGFDFLSGYDGFLQLLEQAGMPEVVYAANDRVAQGVYKVCEEKGIRIPDDIGVVAFGHKEFADLMHPKLTIINSPPDLMGKRAIELLIREITNPSDEPGKHIYLETELISNQSLK